MLPHRLGKYFTMVACRYNASQLQCNVFGNTMMSLATASIAVILISGEHN